MVTYVRGSKLSEEERRELLQLIKERALLRGGSFSLASGSESSYYFDGKMVTTLPRAARLAAIEVLAAIRDTDAEAIGGLGYGAIPLASNVALLSDLDDRPIRAFFVREERKKRGTMKLIEGNLPAKGSKVAIVDDVITKGGSINKAIEAVQEAGCEVVRVVVLVDRQQGGSDELKQQGYDFVALFKADPTGELSIS